MTAEVLRIVTAPKRTALRYYGGKWKMAKFIVSHFPKHRVYVEPFMGACNVLLRKPRSYAEVVSDLDGEIVNYFKVLRDPDLAQDLERIVRLTPFARAEFYEAFEECSGAVEIARRTLMRSLMGFGSDGVTGKYHTGFRNDTNRSGTTPAHDWRNYARAIETFNERLRGVVIENLPAVDILEQFDTKDTLFYVDPPYVADTRCRSQAHGYRHEMTDIEHRELAALLHQVKGMVVLSGYATELYDIDLYADWKRVEFQTHSNRGRERTEVLWINSAASHRHQGELEL